LYLHQVIIKEIIFDLDVKLLVLEEADAYRGNIDSLVSKILKKYNDLQIIIVGQRDNIRFTHSEILKIRLNYLSVKEAVTLLNMIQTRRITESDKMLILELTQGNPVFLRTLIYYLQTSKLSVKEIISLFPEKFYHSGLFRQSGAIITEKDPEFNQIVKDLTIVNHGIFEKIRSKPEYMYSISSRQFEEFVGELLLKLGYSIQLTKATRDGGKDLIVANSKDIGNFIYYVECKKYSKENPVGVNLVRELAGTIAADRVTAGILITSSYFSKDALEYSLKMKHQLSLVDYFQLNQWLKEI